MAVSSMVPRENLTYVYWIRYRTTHCGYASVPSEPHLPQVCVFKPMNLHSVLVGTGKQKGIILSRSLKTASDGADATWKDRSFQTVAPVTGNARLPTV